MMIMMWAIFTLMLLIALSFVFVPIFRWQISLGRQNLKAMSPHHWMMMITISLLLPSLAIFLYFKWGGSQQLIQWYQLKSAQQSLRQLSHEDLIIKMKMILAKHPESTQGWFLLGRLYFTAQQFQASAQAFAHAYQLKPKDILVTEQYVNALFFANDMQLTAQAKELLKQLYQLDPNNMQRLNLLALDAYHAERYGEAIDYWQNQLLLTPNNNASRDTIIRVIAIAKSKLALSSGRSKK